jgi:hypothetical protein
MAGSVGSTQDGAEVYMCRSYEQAGSAISKDRFF